LSGTRGGIKISVLEPPTAASKADCYQVSLVGLALLKAAHELLVQERGNIHSIHGYYHIVRLNEAASLCWTDLIRRPYWLKSKHYCFTATCRVVIHQNESEPLAAVKIHRETDLMVAAGGAIPFHHASTGSFKML
jgi:hypothetical protein